MGFNVKLIGLVLVLSSGAYASTANGTIAAIKESKANLKNATHALNGTTALNPSIRIIGGTQADLKKTPWMVSLQQGGGHFCGGSLLDSTTVVTAAHCMVGQQASRVTAVLGRDTAGQESVQASRIFIHEQYQASVFRNDIAVVKLSKPSKVKEFIKLDTQGTTGQARVIGWGKTSPNGPPSNTLLGLNVQIADEQECKRQLNYDPTVSICAKGANQQQTPCNGDSGGPLFVAPNKLVGTVSFGMNCVGYAAYAKVSTLASWIQSKASGNGASNAQLQSIDGWDGILLQGLTSGPIPRD